MPRLNLTIGQIQGWLAVAGIVIVTGYNLYKFYDEATHAHKEAIAANQTAAKLADLVTKQQQTIDSLQSVIRLEKEFNELESYKRRLSSLEAWEKARYCELYQRYIGGTCDAL